MDYLALSDQSFTKFVDGLGSEAYRKIFTSDPDFADRINGGTKWLEKKEQRELDAFVTSELNKRKETLKRELSRGQGLSTASWVWLNCKNLKMVRLPAPDNPDQTPFSINAVRPAYDEFNAKRGPFTHEERGILIALAQQAAPFGQILDLRDVKSFEAVYHIGIASDKIGLTRTKPVVETPKQKPELTPEETKAKERFNRFNKIVGTWVDNGERKSETAATIDAMDSETYKRFILQTKGSLERRFSHLLHPVPHEGRELVMANTISILNVRNFIRDGGKFGNYTAASYELNGDRIMLVAFCNLCGAKNRIPWANVSHEQRTPGVLLCMNRERHPASAKPAAPDWARMSDDEFRAFVKKLPSAQYLALSKNAAFAARDAEMPIKYLGVKEAWDRQEIADREAKLNLHRADFENAWWAFSHHGLQAPFKGIEGYLQLSAEARQDISKRFSLDTVDYRPSVEKLFGVRK